MSRSAERFEFLQGPEDVGVLDDQAGGFFVERVGYDVDVGRPVRGGDDVELAREVPEIGFENLLKFGV